MEHLKTLLKWDDLGVPLFLETPRCFETCVFAWNFQGKCSKHFVKKAGPENQQRLCGGEGCSTQLPFVWRRCIKR